MTTHRSAAAASPAPGFWSRMLAYLAEMFPLPSRLLFAALLYVGIAAFTRDVLGTGMPWWTSSTALGIGSTFAALLMLRLMDELKDQDIDRRLFPERPLPAGRVLASDLRASLWVVILLLVAANAARVPTLVSALLLVGYALLMFRHFFARALLRRHLLLTLATHQPIVPLILLHGVVVSAVEGQQPLAALPWRLLVPFLLLLWLPFLGWEVARKIRAPAEETEYVTYSLLFGRIRALAFAAAAQGLAVAAGVWLYVALGLSEVYLLLLLASYTLVLGMYARFLASPAPVRGELELCGKTFGVVVMATQVLEFGVFR